LALVDVDRLLLCTASSDSSALVRCKCVSALMFGGLIRRHSDDEGRALRGLGKVRMKCIAIKVATSYINMRFVSVDGA
jgi:hypothetical protein